MDRNKVTNPIFRLISPSEAVADAARCFCYRQLATYAFMFIHDKFGNTSGLAEKWSKG